ncbi:MAG: recombinase family protein [Prevotella sp.]|jgi:DNA invertase Pin-like site-specific DNA recombinase|nr:recombinase family protein [Prevotella sp.]
MKAALLLRVSTEVQDLESQIKDLRPVAESMGYEVPEEYIFGEHITGKDDIRKGERQSITKLKKACKTGDISAIFIHEVSRLSRSSIDGRSFVRDFNEMKIPIYFKDRSLWTLNRDTLEEDSTTKMIVGLFFDFAEQELKTLKSRTNRGRRNAASKGLATGGYLNYGYKKDVENGKVMIEDTEALFVQDIFSKYATGEYSLGNLTRYANTLEYPTRYAKNSKKGTFITASGYTKPTQNIKWNKGVISSMLHNKIYIGKHHFQDVTKSVPAIIDKELFDKVQMKLASNPKFVEKSRNYIHLLQKKVVCGHCGNLMIGHIGSNNISGYYLCSSYFGSMTKCGNTTLNYEKFETIVWHFIKNHSDIFMELNEEEKAAKIVKLEEKKKESQAAIKLKERLVQQEQQKVKSLLDLVKSSGGAFNISDIINDKNEIDNTVANYEQQIIKLNSEINLIDNRINQIRNIEFSKETIASIEADRTQMKKVINDVIDHITVYKVNNNAVVMQLEMCNNSTIYNILLNQRSKRIFKYWYIEEHVATFLMGKYRASTLKECDNFYFYHPETLSRDGFPYWGYYLFEEMCAILEHAGLYVEYMPAKPFINPKSKKPDAIPTDEIEFREYMKNKFGTEFDSDDI